MRRRRVSVLLLAGLAMAVGTGMPDRAGAQAPDVVVVAQGTDMQTGDPHRTGLTHAFNALANIYDTLIVRDAALGLRPGLALSWREVDPTTWEFTLRRGVRFHNGEPFNAHAVKFSIERGLDPRLRWPRARFLEPLRSVAVVDEHTVRFTLARPWPRARFLQALAMNGWIVPPRYLEKQGEEALVRRPVGTGPYRFVRWVKDDRVEMEANADYWGGRPKIGRVVIRAIPTESSRLAEVLAGSVHLINIIPPELFGPIERSPRTKLVRARSTSIFFIHFNLVNIPRDRPLADRRVRQAINHAVDRRALISSIMHHVGVPVATFCTEIEFGCDATVPVFPYDPERARLLLREAGHADGFDMTIGTTSGAYPGDRDLTLAVADQLSRAGIRARVAVAEYGVAIRQIVDKKVPQDAVFLRATSFLGYGGDIARANFHSRGAFSLWIPASPDFEQLLGTAEATLDEVRAKDLLRRAQLLFKDEAPSIPLFTAPNAYGLHRDLEWTPRPDLLLTMVDASWKRR